MRLDVDLSRLLAVVRRMGAESRQVNLDVRRKTDSPIDHINIKLNGRGIEIDLSEVDIHKDTGLLLYKERQILLYIQDHGHRFQNAYVDGSKGNKFHVADCRTLEEMRSSGRLERYVITNKLSGEFYITGYNKMTNEQLEGTVRLNVCKNCLSRLDYDNYKRDHRRAFSEFDLETFFDKYQHHFRHLPQRRAGQFDGGYTTDWPKVSSRYRENRKFTCEDCLVNLSDRKDLLHVHHKDGVKTNNRPENLVALCADCHRQQPSHEHMYVSAEDIDVIFACRQAQGLNGGQKGTHHG